MLGKPPSFESVRKRDEVAQALESWTTRAISGLKDYMEASAIADQSPHAAAALLRLAAEKLCLETVNGKSLNNSIDLLVKQGKITDETRQALDVVRVYGNNAVHPEVLSLDDKPDTVDSLFKLVNLICLATITQSRVVEEMFKVHPAKDQAKSSKRGSKS